jgi:hypothetical protein
MCLKPGTALARIASIAQQIANGFAGEIGMSPPGIDNIIGEGIRLPEGLGEEEERRQRR